MTVFDWSIVLILNGSIIAYGVYLSRGVRSSADWFLAGRSLPWWLVGISMYATAIDSSDLVADSGGTYTLGFSYFVTNWVGVIGGWALGAFVVFPAIYRAGMYTNAEYLEARFCVSTRVLCALIQVQYRTLVLAIIATTLYLMLYIVCDLGNATWWVVAAIAALASVYTAIGGLRSVAVTDSLQFGVMTVAGLIIWVVIWNQVGGWGGMSDRLNNSNAEVASRLLHAGEDNVELRDVRQLSREQVQRRLLLGGSYDQANGHITRTTPGWLVAVAFIIVGVAYSIVNHTQTMRMFAARSEWDMQMSVAVAGLAMLAMSFFNLSMGVMGRAIYPVQSSLPDGAADAIYPYLVDQFASVGLKGIVVAGVFAAAFSTFDSIGSTLSALLTRDVYARLFVPSKDDAHYLRVCQWFTPLIIGGSFLYVPFMKQGMLLFYLDLTSAFVTPLLTLFLMGTLTPVHRSSGLWGVLVGAGYGVVRLIAAPVAEASGVAVLPAIMVNPFAAYSFSMLVTATTMVLVSVCRGWEKRRDPGQARQSGWLLASQQQMHDRQSATPQSSQLLRWTAVAAAAATLLTGIVLSFVVFW